MHKNQKQITFTKSSKTGQSAPALADQSQPLELKRAERSQDSSPEPQSLARRDSAPSHVYNPIPRDGPAARKLRDAMFPVGRK